MNAAPPPKFSKKANLNPVRISLCFFTNFDLLERNLASVDFERLVYFYLIKILILIFIGITYNCVIIINIILMVNP